MPEIKNSYYKVMIILLVVGFSIPVSCFIIPLFSQNQEIVLGPAGILLLLIYMLMTIAGLSYQQNNMIIFHGTYKRWKETNNPDEKSILAAITYKDICKFKRFKKDRIKQIENGESFDGFTLVQEGITGCVFYSHNRIHTYTYVLVLGPTQLITIPWMFKKSVFFKSNHIDTPNIKTLFSKWAETNSYKVDHLIIYDRGMGNDPDQMTFDLKIGK